MVWVPGSLGQTKYLGGPIKDEDGNPLEYDIRAQTHAVIGNIRVILEEYGMGLEDIVDVLVFLTDMERDFQDYNEVYALSLIHI